MRNILNEIIELQAQYNASETPAMNRRGTLIRNDLRAALEKNSAILAQTLAIAEDDLIIEGLDTSPEHLAHISPLGWAHILLTGEYRWNKKEA